MFHSQSLETLQGQRRRARTLPKPADPCEVMAVSAPVLINVVSSGNMALALHRPINRPAPGVPGQGARAHIPFATIQQYDARFSGGANAQTYGVFNALFG